MTARKARKIAKRQVAIAPAAAAVQLETARQRRSVPTATQAGKLAEAAVAAAPPTQVRNPWRSTLRTALQIVLGFAPVLPSIVSASGVDGSLPWVSTGLALSAGITRVMGRPEVEAFLQRFVPWLAASPRPPAA